MAGLGLFLYGALRAITGIGKAVDNAQMKKESFGYTDKGESTWLDRNCNQYVNGEKLVSKLVRKPDGKQYILQVGEYSGKVYIDPYQNTIDRIDRWSEERKQEKIKDGYLAYMRYDHIRKREITCEISTGKFIAYLEGDKEGNYKKYYLQPNQDYCHCHCKPEGVAGVPITREEFDKLNIYFGTHSAYDYSRNARQYYKHVGDTTIWN